MEYKEDQSLDDYVDMFQDIYEPIQNLERNFYQVFARLIESIAQCSQYVNKPNLKGLADHVPEVFAWYCGLVNKSKLKISLSDAIWNKFPYICPYCISAPCTCVRGKKDLIDNAAKIEKKAKDNINRKPITLEEWQVMLESIYPRDPETYDQKSNFSHLVEELGEVSEAYRIRYFHPTAIENEIADVFTWIIGMVNLINAQAKEGLIQNHNNFSLQTELFSKYKGCCPKCDKIPCSCISKEGEFKISELNVIYPGKILEAINRSKEDISNEIQNIFTNTNGTEFITLMNKLINSSDITETRVRALVQRLILDPTHKKWYENITLSGITESSIVSALTIIIQNFFK